MMTGQSGHWPKQQQPPVINYNSRFWTLQCIFACQGWQWMILHRISTIGSQDNEATIEFPLCQPVKNNDGEYDQLLVMTDTIIFPCRSNKYYDPITHQIVAPLWSTFPVRPTTCSWWSKNSKKLTQACNCWVATNPSIIWWMSSFW